MKKETGRLFKRFRYGLIGLLLAGVLAALAVPVFAAVPVYTYTLTAKFDPEGVDVGEATFSIYHVGHIDGNTFVLDDPYASSGIVVTYPEKENQLWLDSAQSLADYIETQGIGEAAATATTDEDGMFTVEGLSNGFYLVYSGNERRIGDTIYGARPMYMRILNGDQSIEIKPYSRSVAKNNYQVVKHWSSDAAGMRPDSIEVAIYRDAELDRTVTLSAANDWSYAWTTEDTGANWRCIEKAVPKGYTMTSTRRGEGLFVITNTYSDNPVGPTPTAAPTPDPGGSKRPALVKTGDDTELKVLLTVLGCAGILLIVSGIRRRRRTDA